MLLAFVVVAVVVGFVFLTVTSGRPSNLGVRDGSLAPCPDSPNCVSTQARDPEHSIAPLLFQGDVNAALETLSEIVGQLPRTRVIEKSENYLCVEFRSALFRFVDDVEFFAEPDSGRIHMRSASRIGYSDLGVNRDRIELIRRLFQATKAASTADTTKD
ncbi:MAG: DUF1499 domain-containing protein [Planctomyces sp.]